MNYGYNLYLVNDDMSKAFLSNYISLALAEAAQSGLDQSKIYSIEYWDGSFATVIY